MRKHSVGGNSKGNTERTKKRKRRGREEERKEEKKRGNEGRAAPEWNSLL